MALKFGSLRVKRSKVVPNSWNPNEMDEGGFLKLKAGLCQALARSQEIPPIVVRHHPDGKHYEIVDGYHRHRALGELGEERINVYAIDVDEANARVLTNTLNYLRGRPDRQRYGQGLVELLEMGTSLDQLAELLPEGRDELDQLLAESKVSLEALAQLQGDDDGDDLEKLENEGHAEDDFVELKFKVSLDAARVIEDEIARIGAKLKGKNIRGRALEYMAAQSGQGAA